MKFALHFTFNFPKKMLFILLLIIRFILKCKEARFVKCNANIIYAITISKFLSSNPKGNTKKKKVEIG